MAADASHVVIIGAGMAGLTAARRLRMVAPDCRVTVLDKGRGIGGRMATRRVEGATFDHGAQFFTTHSGEFETTVRAWVRDGVAQEWFDTRVGSERRALRPGHPRYRGSVSMNAIAKHLAKGRDVVTSCRVEAIHVDRNRWIVALGDGPPAHADAVVMTAPVPQSLNLLANGSTRLSTLDTDALAAVRYEPCLAVLAVLDQPSDLPEPGAVAPESGPIAWMADNERKGISARPALTIHPTGQYSIDRWDEPDDVVVRELLAAATMTGKADLAGTQVQRWRYSRPVELHPEPVLVASGMPPLVFAGDAFSETGTPGASVEAAALSGSAAADAVRRLLTG